jgi:hypothetical protein
MPKILFSGAETPYHALPLACQLPERSLEFSAVV